MYENGTVCFYETIIPQDTDILSTKTAKKHNEAFRPVFTFLVLVEGEEWGWGRGSKPYVARGLLKVDSDKICELSLPFFMHYVGAFSQAHKSLPDVYLSCIHDVWSSMVKTHARMHIISMSEMHSKSIPDGRLNASFFLIKVTRLRPLCESTFRVFYFMDHIASLMKCTCL